ncbi:hypothetical protein [Natronorubrum texcoconense]|uniref:Uncharacterized protein n=1 Tax=Natronorubrum texcoconense TaxID=1095776 RepID=A0A1G9HAQ2_9EURY|nr:hypothetical protein [Natronorubrum texcoconense]SDL09979.1 hypothetical protein SAMN04515672_0175 [Natronorubrum texcoconense]
MNESNTSDETAECRYCETELSDDDATYRVLYGRFEHASEDIVSDKLIAGPNEQLEPGADERYYCLDCYKDEHDREKGAHFEYESADELRSILEAADGRLVADARPMTIGGRGWFRIVDGDVQARHSVTIHGDESDDYDIRFSTEPTPNFDSDDFDEFFGGAKEIRLVYLKSVDETPFVAGMNRTLEAEYSEGEQ